MQNCTVIVTIYHHAIATVLDDFFHSQLRVNSWCSFNLHLHCSIYSNILYFIYKLNSLLKGTYTHQHRNPLVVAGAPEVVGWGHGQVAAERCSHCRWREGHYQECHNCPSIEEQKALQDPLALQDRTHIPVALVDCPNLLSEASCTLSRSHLNTTADRAELYFGY